MGMYTLKPCGACQQSFAWIFKQRQPGYWRCEDCKGKAQAILAPIRRDRSYRAHLARLALKIPFCDKTSGCPEGPAGHATFDVFRGLRPEPYGGYLESELASARQDVYKKLITAAFDQMRRPYDDSSVTAFEIVVTQNSLSVPVKYCPRCEALARHVLRTGENPFYPKAGSNESNLIRVCDDCLKARDAHVNKVHLDQIFFSEPWDANRFNGVDYPQPIDFPRNVEGFDALYEACMHRGLAGGAFEQYAPSVVSAAAAVIAAYGAYILRQRLKFDRLKWDEEKGFHQKNSDRETQRLALEQAASRRSDIELIKDIRSLHLQDLEAREKYPGRFASHPAPFDIPPFPTEMLNFRAADPEPRVDASPVRPPNALARTAQANINSNSRPPPVAHPPAKTVQGLSTAPAWLYPGATQYPPLYNPPMRPEASQPPAVSGAPARQLQQPRPGTNSGGFEPNAQTPSSRREPGSFDPNLAQSRDRRQSNSYQLAEYPSHDGRSRRESSQSYRWRSG